MNNALTKTLTAWMMHGLKVQLTADWTEDFYEMIEDLEIDESKFLPGSVWNVSGYCDPKLYIPMGDGEIDGFVFSNESTYTSFGKSGWKPLLFPMSALTKEIEFSGERFVPIERIADIVEDVCFNEEYSQNQFWYEIINGIFRLSFDKSVRLNGWLIEHHFNVLNLSPDEFIEVNETNNPYAV